MGGGKCGLHFDDFRWTGECEVDLDALGGGTRVINFGREFNGVSKYFTGVGDEVMKFELQWKKSLELLVFQHILLFSHLLIYGIYILHLLQEERDWISGEKILYG